MRRLLTPAAHDIEYHPVQVQSCQGSDDQADRHKGNRYDIPGAQPGKFLDEVIQ